MNLKGNLLTASTAWPVEHLDHSTPGTGHRAVYASKAEPGGAYLQPVIAWGTVEADDVRNVHPLVWDELDGVLMPATAYSNFVGLLEPGQTLADVQDQLEDTLKQIRGDDEPEDVP